MPTVEGRHFYRFKYLRSEHWSNLRLSKLASVDAVCRLCGKRDLSNDVHHLNYRRLYDVELTDLVVLCRPCHELTHEAMDAHRSEMEKRGWKPSASSWRETKRAIRWSQLGVKDFSNAAFKKLREAQKAQAKADEQAAVDMLAQVKSERKQRAEDERLASLTESERRRAKPNFDRIKTAMKLGFSTPKTKGLFIELRKVHFWADVYA